jgi:ribose-phosphate pyrophosphokinase
MNTLNLLCPTQSDIAFQALTFSDGQPHLKLDVACIEKLDKAAPLRILCRLAMPADLLLALYAKNTLDHLEFTHVELHVSYLMAARMDRVMQPGEPFSLKVIGGMLNSVHFKKIRVFDPHSEVTPAVIEHCYPVTNQAFVQDALDHYFSTHPGTKTYCLVSPDAGALKKIHTLARDLGIAEVVECMKERDVKTGALLHFKTATESLAGKPCFIVDDLCDGGGTFIGTANMLREKGAEQVVLIVSHGIFSKGPDLAGIDAVYTTDSFREVPAANCFPVGKYV